MKESIRHGGVLRCDMVKVVETKNAIVFKNECEERFVSYSVSSLVRAQAANADWARVKVKVDLCPTCSALVMSAEDHRKLKDQRKAEKLAAKLDKKRPRQNHRP
jgi:hypothetical protein